MTNQANRIVGLRAIEVERYTIIKVPEVSDTINPFTLGIQMRLVNPRKGIVFDGKISPLLLHRLYDVYGTWPFLALNCGQLGYITFYSRDESHKVGLPVPR